MLISKRVHVNSIICKNINFQIVLVYKKWYHERGVKKEEEGLKLMIE